MKVTVVGVLIPWKSANARCHTSRTFSLERWFISTSLLAIKNYPDFNKTSGLWEQRGFLLGFMLHTTEADSGEQSGMWGRDQRSSRIHRKSGESEAGSRLELSLVRQGVPDQATEGSPPQGWLTVSVPLPRGTEPQVLVLPPCQRGFSMCLLLGTPCSSSEWVHLIGWL